MDDNDKYYHCSFCHTIFKYPNLAKPHIFLNNGHGKTFVEVCPTCGSDEFQVITLSTLSNASKLLPSYK